MAGPTRTRLDRARILRAALALIDADGIEHLSMRRLAAELGVEAMSLYNHVPGKAALLEGVAGLIVAEVELPGPELRDWRERLRTQARSLRRVALAHPAAVTLLVTQPVTSPEALAPVESALEALRSAGFDDEGTVYAFHTLTGFVFGQVLQELHGPFTHGQGQKPDGFPLVCALGEVAAGRDLAAEFEFGLTAVLDGLAAALSGPRDRVGP
jgi:AcrR family transcriptional regulator